MSESSKYYTETNFIVVLKDKASLVWTGNTFWFTVSSKCWLHNVMKIEWHHPHSDQLPKSLAFTFHIRLPLGMKSAWKMKADW